MSRLHIDIIAAAAVIVAIVVGVSCGAQRHRPKPPPVPAPVPTPSATLLFSDEFNDITSIAKGGKWQTSWPLGQGAYGNASYGEVQYYVNTQAGEQYAQPFSVTNGVLAITARPTAGLPQQAPNASEPPFPNVYSSGLLGTAKTFAPTFGYLECRVQTPKGRGFWPLVQMFALDSKGNYFSGACELDLVQCSSRIANEFYPAIMDKGNVLTGKFVAAGVDLSADFHVYGMEVTSTKINFYFDGKLVMSGATPAGAKLSKFIAIDLAVGDGDPNGWIGVPDGSTQTLYVDYVRFWSSKP